MIMNVEQMSDDARRQAFGEEDWRREPTEVVEGSSSLLPTIGFALVLTLLALCCVGGLVWWAKRPRKEFAQAESEDISQVDYMPNVTLETVRDAPQLTDMEDDCSTQGRDLEEKHNLDMGAI